MFPKCVLCSVDITEENDTSEHIIPNAIGGRKKVRGFICNTCNNKSGDTWERVLAQQLNPLSLFFRISRERGDAPTQVFQTTSGDSLALKHDGSIALPKPSYSEHVEDEKVNVKIQARDMKEARKMLKGVVRKYPKISVDAALEQAKHQVRYSSGMVKFELNFGGCESGRSIIKSALAVVIDAGKSVCSCLPAIDYLTNENAEACFGYYYEKDLVTNRPEGVPLHCVSVKAEVDSGLILFYAEYFGVQRVVGCLAESYSGEPFTHTYAIDPISGSALELKVDISLSLNDVLAAYRYEKTPNGAVEEVIASLLPMHLEKYNEQELDRVVESALAKALKKVGLKEGDQISPDHKAKIALTISEEVLPMVMHRLGMNKGSDKLR